ncbi:MAG: AlpA family phage regulatory protein [Alphaproteobacteria bacterium]|nr:AlpA family phage regulatory protein [Alphaproteobacteria bacterium]MDE2110511.1 AlpA family phage regulatory protein [Alphaproteobacteria bacterium]MDE2493261.1 AlpA family phage regulatory protein [Alphaproteobacteria bacterium]
MPEPERILRMRTVLQRTGLSRSTLYRKMKVGTFPSQVHISEHCCGWRESAINRWIADPERYVCDVPASVKRLGQKTSLPNALNGSHMPEPK